MGAVVENEPHDTDGNGWRALVFYGHSILFVDPATDGALENAIGALVSPTQQRYWTVDYSHDDPATGREVWRLERLGQRVLEDALGAAPLLRLVPGA